MLTTLAFCFALHKSPAVSLPAGFYNLQDIADALAKQNVVVAVAPSCAKETYALRAEGVDWDKLRAALEADARLSITEIKNGWQIERSVVVKRDESRASDVYSSYALNTTHTFFSDLARLCAEMEAKTPDERHVAVEKAREDAGTEQGKADAAQQFYLFSDEHDMAFYELGIPGTVTDPNLAGLGRPLTTNLYDARYVFLPDGDLSKFPIGPAGGVTGPGVRERWARGVHVIVKLAWDPVTLQMAYRMIMFEGANPTGRATANAVPFVPKRFRLSIPTDVVWNAAARDAIAARAKASSEALSGEATKSEAGMPGRAIRVSEALLRAADAAKVNLVYYVSPLTDYRLPAGDTRSIARVVADVNEGRLDADELGRGVAERIGVREPWTRKPAFTVAATLTAHMQGDFCVVRNEMRFLDGLCAAPATVSLAFENELLHDRLPKLSQVAGEVVKSPVPGGVSSDALDFCNPISFRPFAAAVHASPLLLKTVIGLDLNKTEDIPFSKLESSARSALLSEIQRCGPVCDATGDQPQDPLIVSQMINVTGTADLHLQVTPTQNGFTFCLMHLKEVLWMSSIRNVSAG